MVLRINYKKFNSWPNSFIFLFVLGLLSTNLSAQTSGSLQIISLPGYKVYFDQQYVGTTNEEQDGLFIKILDVGDHDISIEKDGYNSESKRVRIRLNRITEVKFEPLGKKEESTLKTEKTPPPNSDISRPLDCMIYNGIYQGFVEYTNEYVYLDIAILRGAGGAILVQMIFDDSKDFQKMKADFGDKWLKSGYKGMFNIEFGKYVCPNFIHTGNSDKSIYLENGIFQNNGQQFYCRLVIDGRQFNLKFDFKNY